MISANNLQIKKNIPLKKFTTFKIGGPAEYFVRIKTLLELKKTLLWARGEKLEVFLLGGGSNLLVSDAGIKGLVVSISNLGLKIEEKNKKLTVTAQAGEPWDLVVKTAVKKGLWGIENLSSIPGSAGAFVVQNVGAYGQSAKDVVETVEVLDRKTLKIRRLKNGDCHFAYRKSIFNSQQKGRFVIWSVRLKLKRNGAPNLSYPVLKGYFENNRIEPTIKNVRKAVIEIRKNKLPGREIGSAGSFFKNLVLNKSGFKKLRYTMKKKLGANKAAGLEWIAKENSTGKIKIPTAFLIQSCGMKNAAVGGAKIYEKHALVMVNSGNATATDVLLLMKKIRQRLFALTGAIVYPEPEFVGFTKKELASYFSLR